jgi:hypothetical protein
MPEEFPWDAPPLDPQDQRLVEAYRSINRSVDRLPYTQEFEKLRELVSAPDTDEARRFIYQRLLTLRKMGRLPGLGLRSE